MFVGDDQADQRVAAEFGFLAREARRAAQGILRFGMGLQFEESGEPGEMVFGGRSWHRKKAMLPESTTRRNQLAHRVGTAHIPFPRTITGNNSTAATLVASRVGSVPPPARVSRMLVRVVAESTTGSRKLHARGTIIAVAGLVIPLSGRLTSLAISDRLIVERQANLCDSAQRSPLMNDNQSDDTHNAQGQHADRSDVDKTPVKRRRPIRRIFVGGVIGGSLGVILLLVLVCLVIVQGVYSATNPTEGTSVAWSFAGILSSFACFGLPTIVICTLIGALGGFIRSIW